MLTGRYLPGDTVLHRAAPGVKVGMLAVFTLVLFAASGPATVALCAALAAAAYGLARIPPRVAWAQLRSLSLFVALLFVFQVWNIGWVGAAVICANLVVAVAGASLVTLTTRIDDLRSAVERGLERLRLPGVDPQRVGLVLALAIRAIPVVAELSEETRHARRARGVERSLRAFVTPIVVRTVRHAERVGDALVARGVDD